MRETAWFSTAKKQLLSLRTFIAIGWIGGVCACYTYHYIRHLHHAYPILRQVRELGIIELIKRFLAP